MRFLPSIQSTDFPFAINKNKKAVLNIYSVSASDRLFLERKIMIGYNSPDWGMGPYYARENLRQLADDADEKNFKDKENLFLEFAKKEAPRFAAGCFFEEDPDLLTKEQVETAIKEIDVSSILPFQNEWSEILYDFASSHEKKDWIEAYEYAVSYAWFTKILFVTEIVLEIRNRS